MHAGRHYTLGQVFAWTRRETFIFGMIAAVPTALYELGGCSWLTVPWLPIAAVGTAVAFVVGFKNNSAYARLWEARQIWGAIVNASRTWGVTSIDFVREPGETHAPTPTPTRAQAAGGTVFYENSPALKHIHTELVRRHIAWLTALRYQLRETRAWENVTRSYNREFHKHYKTPEDDGKLDDELSALLSPEDKAYVLSKKNRATQIIALQSHALRRLAAEGRIQPLQHIELQVILKDLYEQQGKCERIKNFPYPRQFATLTMSFVWLFIVLVPFGLLQEFKRVGDHYVWMTIPASMIVAWVFHTTDKIGESSENPFEGGPNDVPITAMSRAIEIDLREMLDEQDIPPALQPTNHILM
jgi:putative membrane protein